MSNRSIDDVTINIDATDRPMSTNSNVSTARPASHTNRSSGSPLSWILLVAIGGFSSFNFYQLNQTTNALNNAQVRIQSLENQLSATGEEMGESTIALQARVRELSDKYEVIFTEVDKLWGSAWRRNQKEIGDLNKQLATVKANDENGRSNVRKELGQLETSLTEQRAALEPRFEQLINELLTVNIQLEQLATTVSASQDQTTTNDKIATLEQRNTAMNKRILQLEQDNKWLASQIKALKASANKPATP